MNDLADIFLSTLRYWNDRYRGKPRVVYVNPSDYDKLLGGLSLVDGSWNGIEIICKESVAKNKMVFV
jgi:hypothetical protein